LDFDYLFSRGANCWKLLLASAISVSPSNQQAFSRHLC
jgi:hypothetical protein